MEKSVLRGRIFRNIYFILINLLAASALQAQVSPVWFERAEKALAEERFEDAEQACEWILEREPENVEIRYMLAQAQLALGMKKPADRSIQRVLKHDPENVAYLELQLAIDFPFEPLQILRNTRRDDLSAKILALDSLSTRANTQLGRTNLREWMRGRSRVSARGLEPLPDYSERVGNDRDEEELDLRNEADHTSPQAERPADIFNLEQQDLVGHDIVNKSGYANKVYPRAVMHFRRALKRVPTHLDLYIHLAQLYVTRPDIQALESLADSLKHHLPREYFGSLLKGFYYSSRGQLSGADAQYSEAFKLMPDSIRNIFHDPERIMNKEELNRIKQSSTFSTQNFWKSRDPRLLTSQNERKLEHISRIVYSGLVFSEPKLNLQGWDSERGEIYVRYGRPDREYFLSNTVANCGKASYDNFHVFEYADKRFVFGNAIPTLNEFTLYSPCAQALSSPASAGARVDYVIIAGEEIRKRPEEFRYDPPGRRIEFPYLVSTFKGTDGLNDVIVPYGIPLAGPTGGWDVALTAHAGAFLIDENGGIADEHHRHTTELPSEQTLDFKGATLWLDVHRLTAPPGNFEASIELETKRGAVGFHRTSVESPVYTDGRFHISDLLPAYHIEELEIDSEDNVPGSLHRNNLHIQPAPWGVFGISKPMYLYFEMYNLQQEADLGTRYEIEAVMLEYREEKGLEKLIRRVFRRRAREGVSVSFEGSGTTNDEGYYFFLDTQDQSPGTYMLVVQVRDLVSEEVAETRRMVMLE